MTFKIYSSLVASPFSGSVISQQINQEIPNDMYNLQTFEDTFITRSSFGYAMSFDESETLLGVSDPWFADSNSGQFPGKIFKYEFSGSGWTGTDEIIGDTADEQYGFSLSYGNSDTLAIAYYDGDLDNNAIQVSGVTSENFTSDDNRYGTTLKVNGTTASTGYFKIISLPSDGQLNYYPDIGNTATGSIIPIDDELAKIRIYDKFVQDDNLFITLCDGFNSYVSDAETDLGSFLQVPVGSTAEDDVFINCVACGKDFAIISTLKFSEGATASDQESNIYKITIDGSTASKELLFTMSDKTVYTIDTNSEGTKILLGTSSLELVSILPIPPGVLYEGPNYTGDTGESEKNQAYLYTLIDDSWVQSSNFVSEGWNVSMSDSGKYIAVSNPTIPEFGDTGEFESSINIYSQ